MIKIKRSSCPKKLKKSKAVNAYRLKIVVSALWKMQHKKCCYCEMNLPETGHGKAVEHFKPKVVFESFANDWENLLLACPQCNGSKSDKFPVELTDEQKETKVIFLKKNSKNKKAGRLLLIDPSDNRVDPEKHIGFVVETTEDYGVPYARNGSPRGRATINTVGLDDNYYCRERREFMLEILEQTYFQLLAADLYDRQQSLDNSRQKFESYMAEDHRFAAFAREFARAKKLDRFGIEIP